MSTTSAAPRRAEVARQRSGSGAGSDSRTRRTQAERRAESDRRILDAAAALVVERGIEGTSLAEIGRRAGYSHGLVHHRFGSKDALVERLTDEAVHLFTDASMRNIGDATGARAVRIVAETYLDLVQGPHDIARVHLLVWSEAIAAGSGKRPYRARWDRIFRRSLAALVAAGVAEGTVRPEVDPDAAAVVIVGLLRGVALQLLLDDDAGEARVARDAVLQQVDRMLRPAGLSAPAGR